MTEGGGWRVTATRAVLRDRWIDLRADDCVTAGGKTVAPYYILRYPEWVHVVAITEADELVLVRQYRHGAAAMVLELPGGMVDPDDPSPEHAGRRELLEETGYEAGAMHPVSALWVNPASHTNRVHAFAASGARRVRAPSLEAGEDGLAVVLLPMSDALARLDDGVLGQAMQVSALLLGLARLGRLQFTARSLTAG